MVLVVILVKYDIPASENCEHYEYSLVQRCLTDKEVWESLCYMNVLYDI